MAKSSRGRPNKNTQKGNRTHFWFKQDGWRQSASLRLWQCATEFLHETTLSFSALLTMNLRDSPTPENKCDTDRAVRPVARLNIFDSSAISGDHLPRKSSLTFKGFFFLGLFIYFHYRQICRFIHFSAERDFFFPDKVCGKSNSEPELIWLITANFPTSSLIASPLTAQYFEILESFKLISSKINSERKTTLASDEIGPCSASNENV